MLLFAHRKNAINKLYRIALCTLCIRTKRTVFLFLGSGANRIVIYRLIGNFPYGAGHGFYIIENVLVLTRSMKKIAVTFIVRKDMMCAAEVCTGGTLCFIAGALRQWLGSRKN